MEKKKLFCIKCDEKTDYVLKSIDIVHVIKGENITLKNIEIPHCSVCGEQLSDLDIEENHFEMALNKYRADKSLLMPVDIKKIREQYGLSQRAFARALGFAESTINRYELGALQDSTHNSILLLSKQPRNFLTIAMQNKEKLSENEIEQIYNKTKELDMEDRAQGLIERGMTVIENDAIKRLELMVIGLSRSIDNIEKLLNRVSVKQEPLVSNFTQFLGKPLKQPQEDEKASLWDTMAMYSSATENASRKERFRIGR
ncbi:MAG: type II toxin-antitoxin system MqsA family antitoxin [Desulfitobacteriaceae bacterium]|nr:type II toxin-antitoxin system MqsA family antitoxin [Desulfitobacteriaceae bacterium]